MECIGNENTHHSREYYKKLAESCSNATIKISYVDGTSLVGKIFIPHQGRVTDYLRGKDTSDFTIVTEKNEIFVVYLNSSIKNIKLMKEGEKWLY